MWCCNCVHTVMNYGSSAVYKAAPSPEQIAAGVVPLDSLPAAWWNCMWCDTNSAVNEARDAIGSFIDEVNTVLSCAGITPNCTCVDTLYRAVEKIRTTVGNAVTAGAVKSSTTPGEVSIDANGIMTANCVGNATNLTTSARTLVGAVNELKQTYDCCFSDAANCFTCIGNTKAPNMHACCDTTYGVGNADCYGHLKISDTFDTCVGGAAEGLAASQAALYTVYDCLSSNAGAPLGNTAGCADTAIACIGSALTAARSDHTHPYPKCINYYCANGSTSMGAIQIGYDQQDSSPAVIYGRKGECINEQMQCFTTACICVGYAYTATESCRVCIRGANICIYKSGCCWWACPSSSTPGVVLTPDAGEVSCLSSIGLGAALASMIGRRINSRTCLACNGCAAKTFWVTGIPFYVRNDFM